MANQAIPNEGFRISELCTWDPDFRDRKNKLIALSQASYIDKVLEHFSMQNSKKGFLPSRHGVILSKAQCPKTPQEEEDMRRDPICFSS